jgi:hypothetical protein
MESGNMVVSPCFPCLLQLSTVDQFSGESKPVTLALGGEEVTSFTPENVFPSFFRSMDIL